MNAKNDTENAKSWTMMTVFALVFAAGFMNCALAEQGKQAARKLRIFDKKPKTIIVNGYSTSFQWPKLLQEKLDRMSDSKRVLTVRSATKSGTPIAKWMDVKTGEPLKPWLDILRPKLGEDKNNPAIVLGQQSLQWAFGERAQGIRNAADEERIKQGADALEKYVRLLKKDGADLVFVAMHIYKHPMEPEIGNERLALAGLMRRKIRDVVAGPDVWTPTKEQYPQAFARDKLHPNELGAEIMAQKWFETLLKYDGLEVPRWSRKRIPGRRPGETTAAYHVRTGRNSSGRLPPRRPGESTAQYTRRISRLRQERERQGQVPDANILRDVEYVPGGHERQKLDIYLPKERSESPAPLIIWIHGGAWRAGSKDRCPARRFLDKGCAVASINYRLSQHAIFPAQIEDCKAAIRWLRANAGKYGFDPKRFGVWGSSAGGHLVALLGTTGDVKEFEKGQNLSVSSRVQAVCDYFGPTDFTLMSSFWTKMGHDSADSPESRLVGGPVQQNKEKCRRANPITYVTKDDPPFLIVHGDKDPLVPRNQSEILHKALQKAGIPAKFHTVKGGGHGGFKDPAVEKMVEDFFDECLKFAEKAN